MKESAHVGACLLAVTPSDPSTGRRSKRPNLLSFDKRLRKELRPLAEYSIWAQRALRKHLTGPTRCQPDACAWRRWPLPLFARRHKYVGLAELLGQGRALTPARAQKRSIADGAG